MSTDCGAGLDPDYLQVLKNIQIIVCYKKLPRHDPSVATTVAALHL